MKTKKKHEYNGIKIIPEVICKHGKTGHVLQIKTYFVITNCKTMRDEIYITVNPHKCREEK